jgi:hypothetical protein
MHVDSKVKTFSVVTAVYTYVLYHQSYLLLGIVDSLDVCVDGANLLCCYYLILSSVS